MINTNYIAKILPVGGEIQDGDIITGKNGVSIVVGNESKHGLQNWSLEEIPNVEDFQKSKFFLCTKEISDIGDKVFLGNNYNYFAFVIDKIGGSDRDIVLDKMPEERKNGTLDYREMIIVFGEISSHAIWVKEGDEFNEEQFRVLETGGSSIRKHISKADIKYKDTWIIHMRCPTCKTYH